ncbi:MAG: metalloregulator ArsR/SmtB family transcription factor [Candidatus Margulisbacteria bacterium]|nr:metalloregulator ArsR/SmtB family transcription factor [Candidatus Margulisiibacteriota bacterium]
MTRNAKCCRLDLKFMAQALQTISEPNRLKIICLLRRGERCVCQLEEALKIKHNLICHHLKALSGLGLLKSKSRGNFTFYSLDNKAYQALLTGINKVLGG